MPTVLVVDDSAVDRRLVQGLLEKQSGWEVDFAENGKQALSQLQAKKPDIVVTDLQMPEMDGLDLVRAVRIHFTDLPVILMTGKGSESLAIEALEQGAASYVPKSQLSEMLPDVLEEVMSLVRADRSYEKLIECMARNEFTFHLTNDQALIDPLVDLVQQMVFGMRLCDSIERVRVGVALEQALLNALYRGNLELAAEDIQRSRELLLQGQNGNLVSKRRAESPYSERRIHVEVRITPEEARFVIHDEGPGFDVASLPEPGDPGTLEQEGGRGLVLMRTFMDEVSYNEQGNQVTMVKRRKPQGDA
ncbi:MAG: response regulator [Pirellulaceae bacterium]